MTIRQATFETISPIDDEPLARYERHRPAEVDAILGRASASQSAWELATFDERALGLRHIAHALRAGASELAAQITAEMGKPLREARAEVEKCVAVCEYYAEHGAALLAPERLELPGRAGRVQFPPLGVVLAIMPWNYPVWQVMRAVAPALMAGNAVVLKHAVNVLGCAVTLRRLLDTADVPGSPLELIIVDHDQIETIIADDRIGAVTLTGSERAGIAVAGACARHLKKSVLELGGSDPFIVLSDADVSAAVAGGVAGRFLNAGQSCIAAKRFILSDQIADDFEDAFAAAVHALQVGDPRDETSDLGPMARKDLRDILSDQTRRGVEHGGRLLCGGRNPDRPGAWFVPTVVTDVDLTNPLAREETFGPVAALLRAPNDEAALEMANTTAYGLSSSIWSRDAERAGAMAARIRAGAVFINAFSASDPRVPFGGIKRSGWGRELGAWGIREFVNVQAVTAADGR